jgi:hypothetical protein
MTCRWSGLAATEWRANWGAVVVGALGVVAIVLHIYNFGVFLPPVSAKTGWANAATATGFIVLSIITVAAAPAIGTHHLAGRLA